MPKTIVLQSFRSYDVPTWVLRCQASVKRYARQQGWEYSFLGDELFNFAPAWAKEAVNNNIFALSDICRLEWMRQTLTNWDTVIWADIDILVIDPNRIIIDISQSYGFSYELYLTQEGPYHGLNNAFMFFQRNSSMLLFYLEKCYEVLHKKKGNLERTAIGPDLLRELSIPESHIIRGLNILNFGALYKIYKSATKEIPYYISSQTKSPIGAANLCLNERSNLQREDRITYDHIIDNVSEALLKNVSNCIENLQQRINLKQQAGVTLTPTFIPWRPKSSG